MVEHKSLAEALSALQAEMPRVAKDNTAQVQTKGGGSYGYSYANLTDVSDAILPKLAEHGLSFVAKPTLNEDGKFVLEYKLMHTSGGEGNTERGTYPLVNGTPQEMGSAITYARRYALCAVTGLAPGGDDDDAASATRASNTQRVTGETGPKPTPPATKAQIDKALLLAVAAGTMKEAREHYKRLARMGADQETLDALAGRFAGLPEGDDEWTADDLPKVE